MSFATLIVVLWAGARSRASIRYRTLPEVFLALVVAWCLFSYLIGSRLPVVFFFLRHARF